ncbi:hypothetical protein FJV41_33905 [Myxococcus llanfairpwllgwyngyllgogerychwyrndrobwllllantysiliogogogochensis]|uniref:Bacterial surface antigen (D15) domain-containing protein n=1 Tax=Myxococcus llanfairpwllgwyngyllgogerychwyrndrobwllllantysiliogogogochensis TaxID=2590453 RepID=A0A540WR74_9BACT|nr:hypothetical protein [Myxococcus llanfairpwllgwyngyllgogerychwyrndrobwllllantysiliogogogochensis]TQF11500.1 hypothetical protein FJV41_33905 [Myxococcus llanfairpwllgwyngyllgogerychwyrndrobwllllantysiliogogogochensis]
MRHGIAVHAAQALLLVGLLTHPSDARASGPPTREEYFRYVPLAYPRIVRQTTASEALSLYGDTADPSYRDETPRDGMDDNRFRVLQALAVRFAPILVKNTYTFPMDHKAFRDLPGGLLLNLDTWDLAKPGSVLMRSDSINFSSLGHHCPEDGAPEVALQTEQSGRDARDDCRLIALLREFHPDHPTIPRLRQDAVAAEQAPFTVMYFDFPGFDPSTWHEAYASPTPDEIARRYQGTEKVYAHPFLSEVRDAKHGLRGYELLIQYWFFYPFNAGGNNHEGDWEHVSAVISPLSAVERPLTEDEMRRILAGGLAADGPDPLVLKRTEYFFHRNSMVFDFASPNAYLPRKQWEELVDLRGEDRPGEKKLLARVRSYVWADEKETRINTHPIGYIGADSKGLEQLLASPGPHARESHATYPLPGVFKDVGPAGSTEAVPKHFDHQEYLSDPKRPLPEDVVRYDMAERIDLVPDWERVYDLAIDDPSVRREWSWLILPLRWGYPSAASPLAGIVAHSDMGNLSITGPAFSEGWNRPAPNAGFVRYAPGELPWFFPLDVQDDFSNNLGFLNGPVAILISLPPFDFLYRVVGLPIRALVENHEPVYTPQKQLPRRRVSVEAGISIGLLDEDFAALLLNDRQLAEWGPQLLALDPTISEQPSRFIQPVVDTAISPTLKVSFYLGDRFTSENTLLHSRSDVGIDVPLAGEESLFRLRAKLNLWEYAGSIRYNILPGGFQPYVKVGYGLTWYRLEEGNINGVGMANPNSYWIRLPGFFRNLWPNTLHLGAGLDVILVRGFFPGLRGLDGGLRAGYVLSRHELGIRDLTAPDSLAGAVTEPVHVYRNTFELLGTLSF